MAKKADIRISIELESTEGTGYRYRTVKNRRTQTGRMELKKYNPILKRMTVHKEIK